MCISWEKSNASTSYTFMSKRSLKEEKLEENVPCPRFSQPLIACKSSIIYGIQYPSQLAGDIISVAFVMIPVRYLKTLLVAHGAFVRVLFPASAHPVLSGAPVPNPPLGFPRLPLRVLFSATI